MKKILVVVVVLAVALMGASSAFALIANSKHDLSFASTAAVKAGAASLSSCQFCHTPHLRIGATSMAPLWNKTMAAGPYTMYTAVTGTVSVGAPGEASKTCLSCHDGTLSIGAVIVGTSPAIPNVAGSVGAAGAGRLDNTGSAAAPNYNLGTDLTNEHPVGVSYPVAGGGAAGLSAVGGVGTDPLVITGDATKRWKLYTTGAEVKVECGSCHDPHNTTVGETPFLKGTAATICSDCHSAK